MKGGFVTFTALLFIIITIRIAVAQAPSNYTGLGICGKQNPTNYTDCTSNSYSAIQCCFVNSTQLLMQSASKAGATFSPFAYSNIPNYCMIYDSNSITNGAKSYSSLKSPFGTDQSNLLANLYSTYQGALKCSSSYFKLSLIFSFLCLMLII